MGVNDEIQHLRRYGYKDFHLSDAADFGYMMPYCFIHKNDPDKPALIVYFGIDEDGDPDMYDVFLEIVLDQVPNLISSLNEAWKESKKIKEDHGPKWTECPCCKNKYVLKEE